MYVPNKLLGTPKKRVPRFLILEALMYGVRTRTGTYILVHNSFLNKNYINIIKERKYTQWFGKNGLQSLRGISRN